MNLIGICRGGTGVETVAVLRRTASEMLTERPPETGGTGITGLLGNLFAGHGKIPEQTRCQLHPFLLGKLLKREPGTFPEHP